MQDNTLPKKPSNALIWIGGILIFFALIAITVAIYDLFFAGLQEKTESEEAIAGLMIFGFAPFGLALFLFWLYHNNLYHYKIQLYEFYELKIIDYAMNKSNRVVLVEIAVSLNVSTDKAKTILDSMVSKGIADLLVSEEGFPVYQIKGIGINKDTAKYVINE